MHQVGTNPVKVMSGVRRCGKSALMELLITDLLQRGTSETNIFYKRFDEFALPADYSADHLVEDLKVAMGAADHDAQIHVFLDEIQEVEGWERVIRSLEAEPDVDVFITGSNADILSSDLATKLSGRYIIMDIFPLSFTEYRMFRRRGDNEEDDTDRALMRYLRYGGMPGLFSLADDSEDEIARLLESIHDSVILNDVARRFAIRDIALLEKLVSYVFSTSGSLFSTRNIVNALTSAGRKTTYETVENYLMALERGMILYGVEQAGIQGKKILRPLKKYYPVDTGLRNLADGFSGRNLGFQLENAVYIELLRRGYTVRAGAGSHGEIDFLATKGSSKAYYQVTESMIDPATRARELRPLEAIADSFPKFVLVGDSLGTGVTEDGIQIVNVADWLLAEER